MAWSYEIDHRRGIVVVRIRGRFGDDEVVAVDAKLRSDPEFRPHYDELVDLCGAEETVVSPDVTRELASRSPLFSHESRRAIVVPTDVADRAAQLFKARRDGKAGEIRIFRDPSRALEWLEWLDPT